jgi:hypothetical protein
MGKKTLYTLAISLIILNIAILVNLDFNPLIQKEKSSEFPIAIEKMYSLEKEIHIIQKQIKALQKELKTVYLDRTTTQNAHQEETYNREDSYRDLLERELIESSFSETYSNEDFSYKESKKLAFDILSELPEESFEYQGP